MHGDCSIVLQETDVCLFCASSSAFCGKRQHTVIRPFPDRIFLLIVLSSFSLSFHVSLQNALPATSFIVVEIVDLSFCII